MNLSNQYQQDNETELTALTALDFLYQNNINIIEWAFAFQNMNKMTKSLSDYIFYERYI